MKSPVARSPVLEDMERSSTSSLTVKANFLYFISGWNAPSQLATYYRKTPRKASSDWPPKFMKFVIHISDVETGDITQLAFLDARRLGRIRLCTSPLTEPPISTLGFDPILSMPNIEEFRKGVLKRSCPIKALLLDQSFSAGVGNWVADEVLYHARVHPEQRCKTLSLPQLHALYEQTSRICQIAVEANADDSKFPEDWLFKHRWGKGKKQKHTMKLPDGNPATIKWITVGGRTSAYVAELQRLPTRGEAGAVVTEEKDVGGESDLTPLSDEELDAATPPTRKRKKSKASLTRLSRAKRSKTATEITGQWTFEHIHTSRP
ncbi:hypothetical protein SCP_0113900 [Sparassis crispa]|uniref:Formamidopyrimidine-DNA glycosylase H2TH DNA-binding domain-containing protein n=1 Tax=Sparassis crispa TaxID=139825 RepID=A0A401G8K7_9APHY|nr:hypothetical protein SCP_0113900 [Sparassis crispa]GBE78501.1 hypothetical protein SCP_0113900 [Sparassis crispa]